LLLQAWTTQTVSVRTAGLTTIVWHSRPRLCSKVFSPITAITRDDGDHGDFAPSAFQRFWVFRFRAISAITTPFPTVLSTDSEGAQRLRRSGEIPRIFPPPCCFREFQRESLGLDFRRTKRRTR